MVVLSPTVEKSSEREDTGPFRTSLSSHTLSFPSDSTC